jgi:hypothetical protein
MFQKAKFKWAEPKEYYKILEDDIRANNTLIHIVLARHVLPIGLYIILYYAFLFVASIFTNLFFDFKIVIENDELFIGMVLFAHFAYHYLLKAFPDKAKIYEDKISLYISGEYTHIKYEQLRDIVKVPFEAPLDSYCNVVFTKKDNTEYVMVADCNVPVSSIITYVKTKIQST